MDEGECPHRECSGVAGELVGGKLRILTHPGAEMSGVDGRDYHDAEVIGEYRNYLFQGRLQSDPVFLVDFGKEIPQLKPTLYPIRFLLLRSVFSVPISIVSEGYWVEVDPFVVDPDSLRELKSPINLDDRRVFDRMSSQMCYSVPSGRDPYVERWEPHRFLSGVRTEPQPYGEKRPRAFDIVVETLDGKSLRGYTRQDDLAGREIGGIVNLNYHLVNCHVIEKDESLREGVFQRKETEGPYCYEVIGGIVRALWWPEKGVFESGDLPGRMFTLQVGDLCVRLEDPLDKRIEFGGISLGDCIHAVGQLEFTWRHEDQLFAMYGDTNSL